MLRVGPTEDHRQAWREFERIKMFFCNVGMLTNFLQDIIFMAMGRAHYQVSEQYMKENTDYNVELAEKIFPFCKWATITMTLGRIFLLAFSYKHL